MMVKPKKTSGLSQETLVYRHHVEPTVKLYVPAEESYLVPLKYIDVTRTADTSVDVMLEKHIDDNWNVNGNRELPNAWTGFMRFLKKRSVSMMGIESMISSTQ